MGTLDFDGSWPEDFGEGSFAFIAQEFGFGWVLEFEVWRLQVDFSVWHSLELT